MAAARPLVIRGERVPLVRPDADELMDIMWRVAHRQGELRAWLAERSERVEAHTAGADACHAELQSRVEQVEASVGHLAQDVVPRRQALRRQRVAVLQQQVSILRGNSPSVSPPRALGTDRLGTAMIYAGSLLLVWLVLWQLALALGLR